VTGFTPPPRREMPAEVRDRLRRKLWRDLYAPARFRFKAPLAVAAAVALLVAGAVLVARAVPTSPEELVAHQPPPSTAAAAAVPLDAVAELDRCYAAVQTAGMAASYPDRPEWTPSFSTEAGGVAVVAAQADGKPLFCESTLTSVTISDLTAAPAFAAGSATSALFATSNGTVAGVVDPAWETFEIRVGSTLVVQPDQGAGVYIAHTARQLQPDVHILAQQLPPGAGPHPEDNDPEYPLRELPPVPRPAVSIVDRPQPADRSSPRGKALEQCMLGSANAQPDRESWQPGAAATVNGHELVMAVNSKGIASCEWRPEARTDLAGEPSFQAYTPFARAPAQADAARVPVLTGKDNSLVILGTVRGDATRMTIQADKFELSTDVRAGTFISVVPPSLIYNNDGDDDVLQDLSTVIYDAQGHTLYEGPLPTD
jgi:hypothetical protein